MVMVLPHGIEPRSSGYRPGALPLSYGRGWCSLQDSNLGMSVCKTDALAAWRSERMRMVHPGGLEPPCRKATASEAAASAVSPRVQYGAATADRTPVSALPKRCPATGRLRPFTVVLAGGLEPPASRLRGECSAR